MKNIDLQSWLSRAWLGIGTSLLAVMAARASTDVTFMIDMAAENPGGAVYISGSFNGWPAPGASVSSNNLINTSGTIWSNKFTITDAPGTVESCKFQDVTTGWETFGPNREFVLAAGSQVLPLTTWNVNDYPTPTNQVKFQVDLSAQVALGNFTPGGGGQTITVSGDFEGWNDGLPLTNNPTLVGNATNIYSAWCPVIGFPPTGINYKFRMNGGWESPASTSGNNRQATVTSDGQVLPLVYYNDNSIYDLVTSPIAVKFAIYMPDQTPLANGGVFTKGVDNVAINGDFLGWWGWGVNAAPASDIMVEVGSSDVYTNTLIIPKGNSIFLTYKYGVDGLDNENGFATNHVRLIRAYPPNYTMPQDVFSWSVLQPGNGNPYPLKGLAATNIVEPDFGYLVIGSPAAGKFPITWLGRPGVLLQNSSSLSAIWNDNTLSDATQATNWPNAGGNQFFRLKKGQ